ncbi:MAG: cytochrome b/b6 domain-containing protein [Gammaproteobacteria bacterium]|nr:cytochrome b/b6 domain-containing protein [Gammaproteobacteria bacterium]
MRNIVYKIRTYHATLACISTLAYITGEVGIIHNYLGYAVSLIIIFRALWALSGHRQLGLMRFYPDFEGLKLTNMFTHPSITRSLLLGIAVSIILTASTGILMDQGESLGLSTVSIIDNAYANGDDHDNEILEEVHEFFANLAIIFVAGHIGYLILFKFPLAKFMLFMPWKKFLK